MATNTEKIVVQIQIKGQRDLDKLGANTDKATKKVGGLNKSFVKMAAGIAAATVAFRIAAKVVGDAIKTFSNFEFELAKVKAVTGATDREFAKLSNSARELGRTTFFTATNVASLQAAYGKLGFTTQEILDAQAATIQLATATGGDLGRAAIIAGSAVRGFGLDASETQRVVDVMAVAFTSSALDIEKWQTSMTKVAPIAKSAGFSIEDTAAIMAKLSDSGIEASIAGTSLRNILLKMQDPTSDLTKSFGKTIHSFDELVPAMKKFTEEGGSMADIMEVVDLRQAAAFEQMLTSAESAEVLRDALKDANGEAQKMADIMADTLQGDLKEVASAWEGFQIAVFTGSGKITKAIRSVLDVTTELLNRLTDYNKTNKELGLDKVAEQMSIVNASMEDQVELFKTLSEEDQKIYGKTKSKFIEQRIKAINKEVTANDRLRRIKNMKGQSIDDEIKQSAVLAYAKIELNALLLEEQLLEKKTTEEKKGKVKVTQEERETLGTLKEKLKELKAERDLIAITNTKALANNQKSIDSTNDLIKSINGETEATTANTKAKELNASFLSSVSDSYWNSLVENVLNGNKTIEESEQELADFQMDLINNLLLDESLSIEERAKLDNQLTKLKLDNYKKTTEAGKTSAQEQKDTQLANLDIMKTAAVAIFDIMGQNADRQLDQERKRLEEQKDAGVISQEQYEAEVEKVQRKAFAQKKKRDSMEVIMNTAMAVAKVFAQTGVFGFAAVAPILAVGAAQLALIQNQKYANGGMIEEFANGGLVQGKSHAQGGEKFAVGGRVVELEGGEAVINKRSTSMFSSQLSAMNAAGGGVKFADGGLLNQPSFSQQQFNALGQNQMMGAMGNSGKVTVVEADITSSQNTVSVIQSQATI